MEENGNRLTTRKGALGRMLGIVAGAVGVGTLTRSKANAATPAPELTLYVAGMRQRQVGPDDTAKTLPFGSVVDAKGRLLGAFHTAALDGTAGTLTVQTFELADGTIVGMGAKETYVVVGSTGRYAGVAGGYVERPAAHLPGRQFTFTFREASHGS